MIYVVSPYSHKNPKVRQENYDRVVDFVIWTGKEPEFKNKMVYSPIMYWHPAACAYDLPTDSVYWRNKNTAELLKATEVIILALPGITNSVGCAFEYSFARTNNYPIRYYAQKELGLWKMISSSICIRLK